MSRHSFSTHYDSIHQVRQRGKQTSPFVDTLLLTATRHIQGEASMATTA